jgi:predicted aconitase with swiveling domain
MGDAIQVLVRGEAAGPALVLDAPLSFWGGLDAETGLIIDRRHPQTGASVVGRVLVMEAGRGSSSASSVLAEAVRIGTAPVAIIMLEPDEIVALGAIVAEELYGTTVPVIVVDHQTYTSLATGIAVAVRGEIVEVGGATT